MNGMDMDRWVTKDPFDHLDIAIEDLFDSGSTEDLKKTDALDHCGEKKDTGAPILIVGCSASDATAIVTSDAIDGTSTSSEGNNVGMDVCR